MFLGDSIGRLMLLPMFIMADVVAMWQMPCHWGVFLFEADVITSVDKADVIAYLFMADVIAMWLMLCH